MHPDIGVIPFINEVDNYHIVFLAIAVAAADALLYALGIPGQVIVDYQGAELQVDAFGGGFRGDHNVGGIPEILYQCVAFIRRGGAADPPGIFVFFHPFFVNPRGFRAGIAAVE